MNISKNFYLASRAPAAAALALLLAACGGGGSGGGSTTESVVSRGVITQLGSIWVNGVEWELPSNGTYSSDDDNPSGDDVAANLVYHVGQMVSIRGQRNDDGVSGVAEEVEYEAEIEGTADASGKILGITILQTPNTNAPGIPDPLSIGTRYEVSGVWIDDTTIEATFIKEDDDAGAGGDGIDEIKGFVDSVNLGGGSIVVRGITFNGYGGTPVLANGDYVEVHFTNCSGDPQNCDLTGDGVQLEDDFMDGAEGVEIEIEGAVDTNIAGCPSGSDFRIDMTCIDWNDQTEWGDGLASDADLAPGLRVEAEGRMVDGKLVAHEIKGRGNRVRISSFASGKSGDETAGTFLLIDGSINVEVVGDITEYDGITFAGIGDANQRLEVRGVRTGPNSMMAIEVKLEDPSDSKTDRHELRAQVDDGGASVSDEITVMQLTSTAGPGTQLELDNDIPFAGTVSQFLAMLDDNGDVSDGPNSVVEVRVDTSGGGFNAEQIEIEEEDD